VKNAETIRNIAAERTVGSSWRFTPLALLTTPVGEGRMREEEGVARRWVGTLATGDARTSVVGVCGWDQTRYDARGIAQAILEAARRPYP